MNFETSGLRKQNSGGDSVTLGERVFSDNALHLYGPIRTDDTGSIFSIQLHGVWIHSRILEDTSLSLGEVSLLPSGEISCRITTASAEHEVFHVAELLAKVQGLRTFTFDKVVVPGSQSLASEYGATIFSIVPLTALLAVKGLFQHTILQYISKLRSNASPISENPQNKPIR